MAKWFVFVSLFCVACSGGSRGTDGYRALDSPSILDGGTPERISGEMEEEAAEESIRHLERIGCGKAETKDHPSSNKMKT